MFLRFALSFYVCLLTGLVHAHECGGGDVFEGLVSEGTFNQFSIVGHDHKFGLSHIIQSDPQESFQKIPANKKIRIETSVGTTDRYGRRLGVISFDGQSLQETLLSDGKALIAAQSIDPVCLQVLRAAEARGRRSRLGVWAEGLFPIKSNDLVKLTKHEGQFVVAEGRIRSVGNRESLIYLNFGKFWSEDFTVIAHKQGRQRFRGDLDALAARSGANVRVRGIIEISGGPMIRLLHESQIETSQ